MEKIVITIILFIASLGVFAQNKRCSDIKITHRCGTVVYCSPTPSFIGPFSDNNFNFLKIVTATTTQIYLQVGPQTTNCDNSPENISITFKDKTKLSYTNIQYLNIVGDSSYVPTILLNEADMQTLKTKKVDFFSIGTVTVNPFLTGFDGKIIDYAACIDTTVPTASTDFDTCPALNKTVDDMKGITTYLSPTAELIRVEKNITTTDTTLTLIFCQTLHGFNSDNATVYVKFDDGSLANFPSQTIYTKQLPQQYFYACRVVLTAVNVKQFKQKKIVKYQFYNTNALVDGALGGAIVSWLNCLDNLK